MIAALRAEGYKLRAAKDGEVITDAAPVIASVSEKRPPPNNGPSTRKSGVADSSSTLLGGDEGEGAGDPEE